MSFEEPTIENGEKLEHQPESGGEVPAELIFDNEIPESAFEGGEPGEVRAGYSFFAKVESGDSGDDKEIGWEHIASDMVAGPTLIVNDQQRLKRLKDRTIRAVPVKFAWNDKKGLWEMAGVDDFDNGL